MNEDEVMNLLNSIDDDLTDEKIDDLLNKTGESVNMDNIKAKAMGKIKGKKSRIGKKPFIAATAAAVAATLVFSTVYADEISSAIKSFFNKSVVYSTVVDGDAYYLPVEVKLNDKFTLSDVSMSKDHLDMSVRLNEKFDDKELEGLDIAVVPTNSTDVSYSVGGYGFSADGKLLLSFMNKKESNYNIPAFKDFAFMIDGESYDISLAKAESIKVDDSLFVGKSENIVIPEIADNKTDVQNMPLIANVAGTVKAKDGLTSIQLVAGFDDSDLKLSALGEPDFVEFSHSFENLGDGKGTIGSGNSSMTKPILAYDKDSNPYTLTPLRDAVGRPITIFETTVKQGTDLTVKLPAVVAGYEKEVANMNISIPKEGEVTIDKELDFIIQKAVVKSIKRTSENSAVVTFDLNTGMDKTVSIEDIGSYSNDVIKAETIIKDNVATMTMTFDNETSEANFTFSWPRYVIQGNWSIELDLVK